MLKMAALMASALLVYTTTLYPVQADWIRADELTTSCDALLASEDSQAGSLCRAFVHGYLVGAGQPAYGASASAEGSPAGDSTESFGDRAVRTRINPKMLERAQFDSVPEYCLGEATELADVARVVAVELASDPDSAEIPDGKAVRRALAREFPCDA